MKVKEPNHSDSTRQLMVERENNALVNEMKFGYEEKRSDRFGAH